MSDNKLTEIKTSTFRGLNQLLLLNLCCNRIRTIEAGSFDDSPKLIQLRLIDNRLTTLDDCLFCKLCHLKIKEVSGNKLDKKSEDMISRLELETEIEKQKKTTRMISYYC